MALESPVASRIDLRLSGRFVTANIAEDGIDRRGFKAEQARGRCWLAQDLR
jgi:hypothetical protein